MTLSIPESIRVLLPSGVVRKLPLEEYVRGVVAATLPSDAPLEALKAQAVAARTFGSITRRHIERGSDVCTLRHCQVWKESATASAQRATVETRGIVAVHGGRLIDAYYFEHCDGNTRDATGILVQVPPYLRSVTCPCGFATLKGHGIGMCQRGAQVMARFGDPFDVILKHYFNGITLERAGGIHTALPEFKTAAPQVVKPPPGALAPIKALEPEAPGSPARTRKVSGAKSPRAKRSAAPSPGAAKPSEPVPPSVRPEASAPVEPAKAPQVVPPPSESAPRVGGAKAPEPVPTPPTTPSTARAQTPIPAQVLSPRKQDQAPVTQPLKPAEPAPPPPPVPAETSTSFQAQPTAAAHEPAPDLAAEEETGWYPVAEEIAEGAGSFKAEMMDEALEASAAIFLPFEPRASPISREAHSLPRATPISKQVGAAPSAPVRLTAPLAPPPATMPEEMPSFPVAGLTVEMPALTPPPPLVEEEIMGPLSTAPPSEVVIDRLPGPRMIAGDLTKPGIIITIRDMDGHAVVTVSGAAPHHGPGGFEAPLASDGMYSATFDQHALEVVLSEETVFICYPQ